MHGKAGMPTGRSVAAVLAAGALTIGLAGCGRSPGTAQHVDVRAPGVAPAVEVREPVATVPGPVAPVAPMAVAPGAVVPGPAPAATPAAAAPAAAPGPEGSGAPAAPRSSRFADDGSGGAPMGSGG